MCFGLNPGSKQALMSGHSAKYFLSLLPLICLLSVVTARPTGAGHLEEDAQGGPYFSLKLPERRL